jgi:hypothetical protein
MDVAYRSRRRTGRPGPSQHRKAGHLGVSGSSNLPSCPGRMTSGFHPTNVT